MNIAQTTNSTPMASQIPAIFISRIIPHTYTPIIRNVHIPITVLYIGVFVSPISYKAPANTKPIANVDCVTAEIRSAMTII